MHRFLYFLKISCNKIAKNYLNLGSEGGIINLICANCIRFSESEMQKHNKIDKNGTWYVMARYVDWRGERKQKCQRGFATKKEDRRPGAGNRNYRNYRI